MSFGNLDEVSKRHKIGGGEWYKIKEGENTIRFLEAPTAVAKYYSKGENKTYYLDEMGAPEMYQGTKKQIRFICWVWDRDDDKIILAELPYSVIKAIDTLGKSKAWAFTTIPPFDISIIKSGTGLDTEYSVQATPNKDEVPKEISDEFKQQKPSKDIVLKMAAKNDVSDPDGLPEFLQDTPPLK